MEDDLTLAGERLLTKLVEYYEDFEDSTAIPRELSVRDRRYYDGEQWTSEEISELNRRNQPVITSNRIAPKINYVLGVEISNRVDPVAYPRTPMHAEDAMAVSDSIRYVLDKEDFLQVTSSVAEDVVVEGAGACIVGVEVKGSVDPVAQKTSIQPIENGVVGEQTTFSEDNRRIEIKIEDIPWDRLIWDPHSRKQDFSDAKYMGVMVWRDYEDAANDPSYNGMSKYLEASKDFSRSNAESLSDRPFRWYDKKRNRIQIMEMYWHDYEQGSNKKCWYFAHFCRGGIILGPNKVPFIDEYGDTYCPIVAVSAYVNRDNYRYGLVRGLISHQDEINKTKSKIIHLLSVRQVLAEAGAVVNPQESQTELAKPDGWIDLQPGALAEGRFQISQTADMAQGLAQVLSAASSEIDIIGPQPAQAMQAKGGPQSGRLAIIQQELSSMEIKPVIDNVDYWRLQVIERIWYLIRQFWTEEKWFRVTDDEQRTGYRFVGINRRVSAGQRVLELVQKQTPVESAVQSVMGQEGLMALQQIMQALAQQMAQTGQQPQPEAIQQQAISILAQSGLGQLPFTASEIAKLDMDIVIDTAPNTAIVQHEEFEELVGLAQNGVLQVPPQLIIEASSLRNKKKLLSIIEQASQVDPAQAQQQQQLLQLQMQQLQAQVASLMAYTQKQQADAAKAAAEAQAVQFSAQKDQAMSMKYAAEAGFKLAETPNVNVPIQMPMDQQQQSVPMPGISVAGFNQNPEGGLQ